MAESNCSMGLFAGLDVVKRKTVPFPLHEYEYNEYRWRWKQRPFSSHFYVVDCCLVMHSRTTTHRRWNQTCRHFAKLQSFPIRIEWKLFQFFVLRRLPQLCIICSSNRMCSTTQLLSKFKLWHTGSSALDSWNFCRNLKWMRLTTNWNAPKTIPINYGLLINWNSNWLRAGL